MAKAKKKKGRGPKRGYIIRVKVEDESRTHNAVAEGAWRTPSEAFVRSQIPDWIVQVLTQFPFQYVVSGARRGRRRARPRIGFVVRRG